MKRFAKAAQTRPWKVAGLALFLLATASLRAHCSEGVLNYDKFVKDIEPLFLTQTYNSPSPGTTCLTCHGDPMNVAYSTFPLVLGQPRANFNNVAAHVSIEAPDLSHVLLKPLPIAAGGLAHGVSDSAGHQFTGFNDPHYLTILHWIIEARTASVGARIIKTEPHPNPFRYYVDIVYFLTTAALDAEVKIYSSDGTSITTLPGTTNVGANRVRWDGRSPDNEEMPTGLYFYTVKARFDDGTSTVKGRCVYTP